jgi:FkbM family methyltransferase
MISTLFWTVAQPFLHQRRFQKMLDRFVQQAQSRLGVGGGGHVGDSGEEAVLNLLSDASRAQARRLCIFDVGANQGQYLGLVLRHLAGHDKDVHCFEPSPSTFALLGEKYRNTAGVRLNPMGLAREAGARKLFSDEAGSGLASLTKRNLDHLDIKFERSETVQLDTLDNYCAANNVKVIDLLKIDVEGHELDVLNGGEGLFAERGVRLVAFEFGGCNIDTRTYVRDYWSFFQKHGMKSFYRIMPSGQMFLIENYHEGLEAFRTTNFLVVLDDAINAGIR